MATHSSILAYRISWTEVYITCTLYVPCNTHFPGITVLTPGNTVRMTVCSSLASLPRSPTQFSALLQKSDRQRVRTCHPQQRPSTVVSASPVTSGAVRCSRASLGFTGRGQHIHSRAPVPAQASLRPPAPTPAQALSQRLLSLSPQSSKPQASSLHLLSPTCPLLFKD